MFEQMNGNTDHHQLLQYEQEVGIIYLHAIFIQTVIMSMYWHYQILV
jgi:hypothetical protein